MTKEFVSACACVCERGLNKMIRGHKVKCGALKRQNSMPLACK